MFPSKTIGLQHVSSTYQGLHSFDALLHGPRICLVPGTGCRHMLPHLFPICKFTSKGTLNFSTPSIRTRRWDAKLLTWPSGTSNSSSSCICGRRRVNMTHTRKAHASEHCNISLCTKALHRAAWWATVSSLQLNLRKGCNRTTAVCVTSCTQSMRRSLYGAPA